MTARDVGRVLAGRATFYREEIYEAGKLRSARFVVAKRRPGEAPALAAVFFWIQLLFWVPTFVVRLVVGRWWF